MFDGERGKLRVSDEVAPDVQLVDQLSEDLSRSAPLLQGSSSWAPSASSTHSARPRSRRGVGRTPADGSRCGGRHQWFAKAAQDGVDP